MLDSIVGYNIFLFCDEDVRLMKITQNQRDPPTQRSLKFNDFTDLPESSQNRFWS